MVPYCALQALPPPVLVESGTCEVHPAMRAAPDLCGVLQEIVAVVGFSSGLLGVDEFGSPPIFFFSVLPSIPY